MKATSLLKHRPKYYDHQYVTGSRGEILMWCQRCGHVKGTPDKKCLRK